MPPRANSSPAPVTFDLSLDLLAKIESCRKRLQVGTVSEVVRAALDRFDFAGCQPDVTPHRQISVRLTGEQRKTLKRFARLKGVSVGELLRLAVEDLPVTKKARPAARSGRR